MGSCKGPPGRETTCSDNINSSNNNTGPHTHNNNIIPIQLPQQQQLSSAFDASVLYLHNSQGLKLITS